VSVYVLTHYTFNHVNKKNSKPLDKRFLESDHNYIFYLIDQNVPKCLQNKKIILEKTTDPLIAEAGKNHLAEWSFLLAEYKHHFCQYPFFMISSRFYEKNMWLDRNLNDEWNTLFSLFNHYDYGFLPSYDRPMRWIDLNWKKVFDKNIAEYSFMPFYPPATNLIENIFNVKMPKEWKRTSEIACNYIGFKNRESLEKYMEFYLPLIHFFLDDNFQLIKPLDNYVKHTGEFRNEKPLTHILEVFSRLYFFKTQKQFFAMRYNGYYHVDEYASSFKQIIKIKMPLLLRITRFIRWKHRKSNTEGLISFLKYKIKKYLKKTLGIKRKPHFRIFQYDKKS
jgi:hypothetical protein